MDLVWSIMLSGGRFWSSGHSKYIMDATHKEHYRKSHQPPPCSHGSSTSPPCGEGQEDGHGHGRPSGRSTDFWELVRSDPARGPEGSMPFGSVSFSFWTQSCCPAGRLLLQLQSPSPWFRTRRLDKHRSPFLKLPLSQERRGSVSLDRGRERDLYKRAAAHVRHLL